MTFSGFNMSFLEVVKELFRYIDGDSVVINCDLVHVDKRVVDLRDSQ